MKKKKIHKKNKKKRISHSESNIYKRLLSISIPVIFLVVLEIAFRIFGYGVNMELFTEYRYDENFLIMNPDVSKKYFTNNEDATYGILEFFRKEKSPEAFRAFVLGASTSVGFPFTSNGTFSRWLKYRLMNTFPEKEIEIVNLSLTAVNSYTVLDFTKQIIDYDPDVVLIYMGHNEYYGALGVGSTSKLGNNIHLVRFLINLQELRIVQFIDNLNQKISRSEVDSESNENLMIRMAGDNNIPLGSEKYQMGIEQYRSNLEDICGILSKKNIPVIISNLISNEKSLRPFISDTTNNELSAEFYFDLATENYMNSDFINAKEQFIKAKELDLLRFRAPEEMNRIINDITNEYSGVYLTDSKSRFEEHSPNGILGDELLIDHVHPHLYGHALISDGFYQALIEKGIISVTEGSEMSFPELLKEMPLTVIDSLKGVFLMNLFLREWPFNRKDLPELDTESSFEARLANQIVDDGDFWYQAMDELSKYYKQNENWAGALKVAEASTLAFPYEEESYLESYRMSIKLFDFEKAEFHLNKAFQLNPDLEKAGGLFSLNMDIDDTESAMKYLDYLLENDQGNSAVYSSMKESLDMITLLKTVIELEPGNIESINTIASIYIVNRYKNAAKKYLDMALEKDSGNSQSLALNEQAEALPDMYN